MSESCSEIRRQFDLYLDGECDPAVMQTIEEHLASCPGCKAAYLEHARIDAALREGLQEETSDPNDEQRALDRVLSAIDREPPPAWERSVRVEPPKRSFRWNWSLRWAAGVAVAAAAVLLALRLGPVPMEPLKPKEGLHKLDQPVAMGKPAGTLMEKARDRGAVGSEEETGRDLTKEQTPALGQIVDKETGTQESVVAPIEEDAPQDLRASDEVAASIESEEGSFLEDLEIRASNEPPEEQPVAAAEPIRRSPVSPTPERSELKAKGESTAKKAIGDRLDALTYQDSDVHFRGGTGTEDLAMILPQQLAADDTLGEPSGLRVRLASAEQRLRGPENVAIELPEQARQWRQIGDFWEWIGRREQDQRAFQQAFIAYQNALQIDSVAAEVDTVRLQRAWLNQGVVLRGNTRPR